MKNPPRCEPGGAGAAALVSDLRRNETPPPYLAPPDPSNDVFPVVGASVFAEAQTGLQTPFESYRKAQERTDRLRASDVALAVKLESAGIEAIESTQVAIMGLVTGAEIQTSRIKRINLFESVQQKHRASAYRVVSAYVASLQKKQRERLRYLVVTTGDRIASDGDLRERKRAASVRLRKWQKWALAVHSVELLLECWELPRGDDGTYHLHANLLVRPRRFLGADGWRAFLEGSWDRFGAHWRDNGKVSDLGELLKYVLKSDDKETLDQEAAAWLYGELRRTRLIGFWNSLRSYRASLRERKLSPRFCRRTGRWILTFQDRPAPEKAESMTCRACEGSGQVELTAHKTLKCDDGSDITLLPGSVIQCDKCDGTGRRIAGGGFHENMILAVTAPFCFGSPWSEPHVVVKNWRPDPVTDGGRKRLDQIEALRDKYRDAWDRAGAPPPDIALAIGDEARRAGSADQAGQIVYFPRPDRVDAEALYRVHTTQLTRPPPDPLGARPGEWIDPETGEIFARA